MHIGSNFKVSLGEVSFSQEKNKNIYGLLGLFVIFIPVALGGVFYKLWRDKKQERDIKARERYMEEEHIAAANASRNGKQLLGGSEIILVFLFQLFFPFASFL